jgi:hypothetical protein
MKGINEGKKATEGEVVQMGRSCDHADFTSLYLNDHKNPHGRSIRIVTFLFHRSHLAMDDRGRPLNRPAVDRLK